MPRILIVEDEPAISFGLEVDLKTEGYTVEVVEDGESAVQRGREGGFDLIVLDVMLPGMDGFQILRQLKHHSKTHAIPVLMLTAQSDGASIMAGIEGGAEAYLSKPVDLPDVVRRIDVVLHRPKGRNAHADGS